jgi:spore germination protein
MLNKSYFFIFLSLVLLCLLPLASQGASKKLMIGGWIPYWTKTAGVADVATNLSKLNEISPFSYTVKSDGTLVDSMRLGQEPWSNFFTSARAANVKIIPTVAWTDGAAIHRVLSNSANRKKHIDGIVKAVVDNNFDGIDIDYENKKVESRLGFSNFIKELSLKLDAKGKLLVCTIEPRTPVTSRFLVVPKNIEYVNDYKIIGKYCDQVRLMTYDQTTGDVRLNQAKRQGRFYAPVSDDDWVAKVLAETVKTIPASKIMVGIPTYGYEYEIIDKRTFYDYVKLRSVSYKTAVDLALSLNINPKRSNSGELAFTYTKGTSTRYVTFSDSVAMNEKVRWARAYSARGVIFFRFDGASDPKMWDIVK